MRQSVITILIGAIASLVGFTVIDYLRGDRCADMGGRWVATSRTCELPTGEMVGTGNLTIFTLGAVAALAVGVLLYRTMLFVTGRMKRAALER